MTKSENLSIEYPKTCILQLQGNFYNAFGESARVLSSVMDYRLKDTNKLKTGFPINALDKVIAKFEEYHINIIVFSKGEKLKHLEFEDNTFDKYKDSKDTKLDALEFIESLCDGINPYTNGHTLNLDEPNTIRMLYKVRDKLKG